MKTYQTLLFDVDNTLLDFSAAEQEALKLLFQEQQIPLTAEIEAQYRKINSELWHSFEEGKLTTAQVVNTRFSVLFKHYGKEVNGVYLEQRFRHYLEQGHQLMEGALQLITELQPCYDLYIVTNGVSETQHKRLQTAGILPMFKEIFVSEQTGFQKPMPGFFDYVFASIPNFSPSETLIIGDSLSADIKGGNLAGIDTCWFNPDDKQNESGISPTYMIHTLDELHHVISGKTNQVIVTSS